MSLAEYLVGVTQEERSSRDLRRQATQAGGLLTRTPRPGDLGVSLAFLFLPSKKGDSEFGKHSDFVGRATSRSLALMGWSFGSLFLAVGSVA